MSPFLFLFLRLFHFKSSPGFRIPFLPADVSAFRFYLFPLSLKSLLGFRTYTGVHQMLSGISEPSFGIIRRLPGFYFDRRAENQFIIMIQDENRDIIIFRLRSKGHFTDRQLSIFDPFKDTNPEWFFEEHGQAFFHLSKLHAAVYYGSVLIFGDHGRSDLR